MLAMIFLLAGRHGWASPVLFTQIKGGMGLKLKACSISRADAQQLAQAMQYHLDVQTAETEADAEVNTMIKVYADFMAGGAFQLRAL
jgi:hypothetical protein